MIQVYHQSGHILYLPSWEAASLSAALAEFAEKGHDRIFSASMVPGGTVEFAISKVLFTEEMTPEERRAEWTFLARERVERHEAEQAVPGYVLLPTKE